MDGVNVKGCAGRLVSWTTAANETLWIVAGQALASLGSLIGLRLLTSVLSPADFGELALGMTCGTFVNQLVFGPIGGAVLRFYAPSVEAGRLSNYIGGAKDLVRAGSVVVMVVAAVAISLLLLTGQRGWAALAFVSFLLALVSGYTFVLDCIQNAARRRGIVAAHQAGGSWGRYFCAAGIVVAFTSSGTLALTGYLGASLLVLMSQYWFYRRGIVRTASMNQAPAEPGQECSAAMLAYARPFAVWGLFVWLQLASDRWALQMFGGSEEVGYYAVLYQLGYYPLTVLGALTLQLLAPITFQQAGDATDPLRIKAACNRNWTTAKVLLLTTLVAALAAYLLHRQIFAVLVAPEYRSQSWLMPWLVLASGLFAAGQASAMSALGRFESPRLVAPIAVTAAIGVGCNVIGAYLSGISGVVCANVVFSGMYCCWMAKVGGLGRGADRIDAAVGARQVHHNACGSLESRVT